MVGVQGDISPACRNRNEQQPVFQNNKDRSIVGRAGFRAGAKTDCLMPLHKPVTLALELVQNQKSNMQFESQRDGISDSIDASPRSSCKSRRDGILDAHVYVSCRYMPYLKYRPAGTQAAFRINLCTVTLAGRRTNFSRCVKLFKCLHQQKQMKIDLRARGCRINPAQGPAEASVTVMGNGISGPDGDIL